MSNFLTTSIGRKFLMSVTGLFLMMFIMVHLTINLLLIFDDSGDLFNQGAHFMATNPAIKIMEPVLALGFLVHIIWSLVVSLQNMKARPIGYKQLNNSQSSSWASRNMLILGALIFVFLVMHIIQFFWKIKVTGDPLLQHVTVGGEEMENTYALVATLFKESLLYSIAYVVGAILLGMHLVHGFWSAFQTIGFANQIWLKRLKVVGAVFAIIIAIGFSVIPLYFQIKF
ncbi:succinate dehydrogenase cytochrome b subunit [Sunxiuqinia elliptica]|uniref:Succinate dehydrogenase / fumarate reductase cytochrome b subunit n=1 Tax=Sunxiuqinia elliptica TaxID=655355 RepID=A0A1I2ARE3_9BACT|nr:succinate dehydrogenase cytochrome b subunit [Sunxiuqinia elliptica]TDO02780.1 succinate dehydrogenase subunit C [Sunxiuqinia elliptica]TDO58481.1 succinate dehydrogenase subunit C [Sunxiuqinia elliptica]SFE46541.1 succinate dehydrogenase / fumarate reductase cytochrome b subunit [Sunxiuqinia elliptica]